MSTTCLRWAMSQAVKGMCRLSPWRPHTLFSSHRAATCNVAAALSTTTDGEEDGNAPGKKQNSAHTRRTIGSVGRKIHQRNLQVIGHDGVNLGTMHRADVLRLMDQQGLKLVPRNENKDPPVYQLMTGKQIHEEQLKLREKQKNKPSPVQVKELTLSSDIGSHDLGTKLRQIQSWLSRKCHVRLTLRKGHVSDTKPPDSELEEILQRMPTPVGFVSKPKMIRDGKAAICILRAPSEKELLQQGVLPKVPNQRPPEPTKPPPGGAADADPPPNGTQSGPLQQ